MKLDGGDVKWLYIERRQCMNDGCRRLHSVLPDCCVPYKHYASDLIQGVLDEDILPEDDSMNEDRPCDATMYRWKHWMMANRLRMEGYLRSAWPFLPSFPAVPQPEDGSLLETLQHTVDLWLAAILRTVYHSGGFLVPC